ncbi:MAG: hypothetical protein AAFQ87_14805, partial [Bacteroidota bacterium]
MSVDKFEQKLREKFESAIVPPSPELWGNIESRIAPKPKRRGAVWFWVAGGSIAAALIVWLLLSNVYSGEHQSLLPENGISQTESPAATPGLTPENPSLTEPQATSVESSNQAMAEQNPATNTTTGQTNANPERRASLPSERAQRSPKVQTQTYLAQGEPNVDLTKPAEVGTESKSWVIRPIESLDWNITSSVWSSSLKYYSLLSSDFEVSKRGPYLLSPQENWWEELPEESEEDINRWAFQFQGGQDVTANIDAGILTEDMEPLGSPGTLAGNDKSLGDADFVRLAFAPNQSFNAVGSDQATLVNYPNLESRFQLVTDYQIKGPWSLRTGLGVGISNRGNVTEGRIEYNSVGQSSDYAGEWTYNEGPSLQNLQLEVPLTLQYRISGAKGALVLGGGLSINHNLNYLNIARYQRNQPLNSVSNRS